MVEKFTYHESLLGLTYVVGWADGENQNSERDVKVQMIMHESISNSTLEDFKLKMNSLVDHESTFVHSIETLKHLSEEQKLNACAWMFSVAIVAASGTEGELDYDHDNWIVNSDNVDAEEKVWFERAVKELGVNEDDVKSSFRKLPLIRRI